MRCCTCRYIVRTVLVALAISALAICCVRRLLLLLPMSLMKQKLSRVVTVAVAVGLGRCGTVEIVNMLALEKYGNLCVNVQTTR